ncbi:MAG: argininosuccinate synthase [Candidatus Bathyarchaeota archaeon]
MKRDKIVLAYSGGLDTSVIIRWLTEKYNADIITVLVELGQKEDIEAIETKARKVGAKKHYTIDARKELAEQYVSSAIKANALYEGKYPLLSALSRPLIASKLVDIAQKEKTSAVAHGCTGKGNDQVRLEVTIKALAPDIKIYAPVREWKLSRNAEVKYAKKHGIKIPTKISTYSIDQNLWGRAIECGPIDKPENEPPPDAFEWTTSPERAPNKAEYLAIKFKKGIPTAVNGKEMEMVKLINFINRVAGKHGIGRIDHIEDRIIGIKSREVYECPAATCILEAHKDLEKLVLTRHELAFKQNVDTQWTWLIYSGLWADRLREDLEAFINATQKWVEGEVKLKMFKGSAHVVGRSSPYSLYDTSLASYGIKTTFEQTAAEGFVELWGLPTRVANLLKTKKR